MITTVQATEVATRIYRRAWNAIRAKRELDLDRYLSEAAIEVVRKYHRGVASDFQAAVRWARYRPVIHES